MVPAIARYINRPPNAFITVYTRWEYCPLCMWESLLLKRLELCSLYNWFISNYLGQVLAVKGKYFHIIIPFTPFLLLHFYPMLFIYRSLPDCVQILNHQKINCAMHRAGNWANVTQRDNVASCCIVVIFVIFSRFGSFKGHHCAA